MDWNCSCKRSIEFRVVVYEVGRGQLKLRVFYRHPAI
jgi:hypothetical protein